MMVVVVWTMLDDTESMHHATAKMESMSRTKRLMNK